jgi:hypothetical protein
LGLKITLLRLKKKQTNSTPSTSGKCNSLTTNLMMLKFGENLLHLLNKNCFKFDTNPTVDFWEEQLSKIKLQRLYHGNPSMNSLTTPSTPGKCSSLTAKPMMLKFGKTFYTS